VRDDICENQVAEMLWAEASALSMIIVDNYIIRREAKAALEVGKR